MKFRKDSKIEIVSFVFKKEFNKHLFHNSHLEQNRSPQRARTPGREKGKMHQWTVFCFLSPPFFSYKIPPPRFGC